MRYGRKGTDDNIIGPMHFAFRITKPANKALIVCNRLLNGFLRQQWLRERSSMLYYTYIAFLIVYSFKHFVCLCRFFFSLKTKIDVSSLLHDNKEKTTYPLGCYGN
jgi:hypothetical protein